MHFHEVGQCILINFWWYSFMRKLIFRAAKQAKHTWYLSLFLRNRNLRPRNLTLESESKFATKLCVKFYTVCKLLHCVLHFTPCVNFYTVCNILHCVSNNFSGFWWEKITLGQNFYTTSSCDDCEKYQACTLHSPPRNINNSIILSNSL